MLKNGIQLGAKKPDTATVAREEIKKQHAALAEERREFEEEKAALAAQKEIQDKFNVVLKKSEAEFEANKKKIISERQKVAEREIATTEKEKALEGERKKIEDEKVQRDEYYREQVKDLEARQESTLKKLETEKTASSTLEEFRVTMANKIDAQIKSLTQTQVEIQVASSKFLEDQKAFEKYKQEMREGLEAKETELKIALKELDDKASILKQTEEKLTVEGEKFKASQAAVEEKNQEKEKQLDARDRELTAQEVILDDERDFDGDLTGDAGFVPADSDPLRKFESGFEITSTSSTEPSALADSHANDSILGEFGANIIDPVAPSSSDEEAKPGLVASLCKLLPPMPTLTFLSRIVMPSPVLPDPVMPEAASSSDTTVSTAEEYDEATTSAEDLVVVGANDGINLSHSG